MHIAFLGDTNSQNSISWIKELERQGHRLSLWSMGRHGGPSGGGLMRDILHLRAWLKKNNPDFLIAYRTTSYGFLAALSGFRPYAVAAQGESDAWPYGTPVTKIKRNLGVIACRKASIIHIWSENMMRGMLEMKAPKERIMIMPRGIRLDKFPFHSTAFSNSEINAVVTRALLPEYHIDVIIRAVHQVNHSSQNLKVNLFIAGDGPLYNELDRLIRTLRQKSRIKLLGRVPNERLHEIFSKCQLYISMPDTDGASASLFEAFAAGLYPMVSDLEANRNWIRDGENGNLIGINNFNQLAERIIQFGAGDNEKYIYAIQKNRQFAEKHLSLEKNISEFVNRYQTLIDQ